MPTLQKTWGIISTYIKMSRGGGLSGGGGGGGWGWGLMLETTYGRNDLKRTHSILQNPSDVTFLVHSAKKFCTTGVCGNLFQTQVILDKSFISAFTPFSEV